MITIGDGMRFGFGLLFDVVIVVFIIWALNEITIRLDG